MNTSRFMKTVGIAAFLMAIAFPVIAQAALSGTYTYIESGAAATITFNGSNFTMAVNGVAQGTGPFRVSGSSVHLNNSATATYTIADANTLMDRDGDMWRKDGALLSGTYTFTDRNGGVTGAVFSGNNFTLTSNGEAVYTGPYIVSGSSVFATSTATPFFTIVDANTLRDSDGDLWRK